MASRWHLQVKQTLRAVLSVLAFTALAAGCGSGGEKGDMKPAMHLQQGAERADAILQETLGAVRPELKWNHGPGGSAGCTKGVAGAATGTGSAKRSITILTVVSEQRRGALIGVIERDWKSRGYKITSVRQAAEAPAVYASTPDGYSLSVEVAGEGQFFLDAATPCLDDSSVMDPMTQPNTHVRSGPFPQRPDERDEFWSAATPVP
ncbi:hypothetical protein ACFVJM_07135 [Streptomyces virginiae]|uniref:hypothetical protein n=1 Tax=Streptomyces virginiae TaxID=1961 RepID=UPI00362B0AFE